MTKEKILEQLNDIKKSIQWDVEDEDEEIFQAIRHLIENRPRVTRDFVQRWAERMSFDTGSVLGKVQPQIYQLEEMLKEAGVEIEWQGKEA